MIFHCALAYRDTLFLCVILRVSLLHYHGMVSFSAPLFSNFIVLSPFVSSFIVLSPFVSNFTVFCLPLFLVLLCRVFLCETNFQILAIINKAVVVPRAEPELAKQAVTVHL